MKNNLTILQINTVDDVGGAARVAYNLHREFRKAGHNSYMVVGKKYTNDPYIIELDNNQYRKFFSKLLLKLSTIVDNWGFSKIGILRLYKILFKLALYKLCRKYECGCKLSDYPASHHILNIVPIIPDIIQCHNLHGNFFDLDALIGLSNKIPTVITLHDPSLLNGGCGHPMECDHWKNGCGQCPPNTLIPIKNKKATAYNWSKKKDIFSKSKLYIVTPSQVLKSYTEQSILAYAAIGYKVIPYGVDHTIFKPGNKWEARKLLSLPPDIYILLTVGQDVKKNPWKDFATLQLSLKNLSSINFQKPVILLCVGQEEMTEMINNITFQYIPYTREISKIALYYQACDIYIHSAHSDTFPNSVLEALFCGKPVIATAVGGIPEQVKGLKIKDDNLLNNPYNKYDLTEATGILVPHANHDAMTAAIKYLLNNIDVSEKLGINAFEDAKNRFDLKRQINDYLELYYYFLTEWNKQNVTNS